MYFLFKSIFGAFELEREERERIEEEYREKQRRLIALRLKEKKEEKLEKKTFVEWISFLKKNNNG